MSQIRKLKTGALIIGGNRMEATPEMIQDLTSHLTKYGDVTAPLGVIASALQNGATVEYDPISKTITGMDQIWDKKGYNADRSDWKKMVDATLNNDYHKVRKALPYLDTYHYDPNKSKNSDSESNLTDIYGDRTFFKYETKNNGTKSYLNNDSANSLIEQRLNNFKDYLSSPEAAAKYRLGAWYTNDNSKNLAGIKALYSKGTPEEWAAKINDILDRAKSGNLKEDDLAFLRAFNITEDPEVAAEVAAEQQQKREEAEAKQAWLNAGYGDDIYNFFINGGGSLNDDGSITIAPGMLTLPGGINSNLRFTDDFYNTYGADGTFDPFKGMTLYNGRLYRDGNPTLARILNQDSGWNQQMKIGDWDAAERIIQTRFSDGAKSIGNPGSIDATKYSKYFYDNPRHRFISYTGLYQLPNDAAPGSQLLGVFDLDAPQIDAGGYYNYTPTYAVFDQWGNLVSNEGVQLGPEITNGTAQGFNTHARVADPNSRLNGMYRIDPFGYDNVGNPVASGITLFADPNNPNRLAIYSNNFTSAVGKGNAILLPEEAAPILGKYLLNPTWMERMNSNSKYKANLMGILSNLAEGWWKNYGGKGLFSSIINQLKSMGIEETDAQALQKVFDRPKGTVAERQSKYIVPMPHMKEGGVLKAQNGVKAGNTNSSGHTVMQLGTVNANPKNAAGATKISQFTDADWADVGALVADLAGIGFAFAPEVVSNIGAAASGYAATGARYYADKARGTEGAGWNALINGALDTATLVPILGGFAKTAKVAKNAGKIGKTLLRLGAVYGLGDAFINTVNKLNNGEELTIRDWSVIANGISSGIAAHRLGGFGKATSTEYKPVTIKGKNGNSKSVEISTPEMKKIMESDDAVSALKEHLVAKANDTDITVENVAEKFDLDDILQSPEKWRPGWKPKEWGRKKTVETVVAEKQPVVKQNATKLGQWWNKTGDVQHLTNEAYSGNWKNSTKNQTVKAKVKTRTDIAETEGTTQGAHYIKDEFGTPYREGEFGKPKSISKKDYDAFKEVYAKQNGKNNTIRQANPDYTTSGAVTVTQLVSAPTTKRVQYHKPVRAVRPHAILPLHNTGIGNTQWPGVIVTPEQQELYHLQDQGVVIDPRLLGIAVAKKGGVLKAKFSAKLTDPYALKSSSSLFQNNSQSNPGLNVDIFNPSASTTPAWQQVDLLNPFASTTPAWKQNNFLNIPSFNQFMTKMSQPATRENIIANGTKSDTSGTKSDTSGTKSDTSGTESDTSGTDKDERQGGLAGTPANFDPMPLMNFGRMLGSIAASNKQLYNWLHTPTYQMQTPLTNTPRFVSSGTGDAYRQIARQLRLSQPITSDATQNWAQQQQQNEKAFNYERLGFLADAKEFAEYLKEYGDYIRNVAANRTDFANQNAQYRYLRAQQDTQQKNANIAHISKFVDNFGYSLQDWVNRNREAALAVRAGKDLKADRQLAQERYDAEYNKFLKDFPTAEAQNSALGREAAARLKWIRESSLSDLSTKETMYGVAYPYNILYAASGGKVGKASKVTYSRDPYPEILIRNTKEAHDAVKRLSDATIRLINQTKPIHVSKK